MFPQGHSSYITHLDWSPDNNFIMSNSGDYEILYCKYSLSQYLQAEVLCSTLGYFMVLCGNRSLFKGTFQTAVN